MKALLWVIVVLVIAIAGFLVYESQDSNAVTPPTQTATSTVQTMPTIIPGTPSVQYQDPHYGFTIYYPSTATLETAGFDGYLLTTKTPVIGFVLDPSMFQGTNLVEAGVYVGATTSPAVVAQCTARSSAIETMASSTVSLGGTPFAVFTSTGAGAGNTYQETIYRSNVNGTCYEIAEMLHAGNIANYPKNSVTAYDQAEYQGILDAMAKSFSLPAAAQ